jgi:hypothetical protein
MRSRRICLVIKWMLGVVIAGIISLVISAFVI